MKDYRKNNIHIKIPAKWTGDDGLFLIVEPTSDGDEKQTLAITTDELRDINYLITKVFIENDTDIMKAKKNA